VLRLVEGVPEFRDDEEVGAGYEAFADGAADAGTAFFFVSIVFFACPRGEIGWEWSVDFLLLLLLLLSFSGYCHTFSGGKGGGWKEMGRFEHKHRPAHGEMALMQEYPCTKCTHRNYVID
jgi:hypothetical protein